MSRNHPAVDFAGEVLKKYPDAYALENRTFEHWRITTPTGRTLSSTFPDRDAAWADAYKRIEKLEAV